MAPATLIERRLYGSFALHYLLEFFGNSAHFAIANIAFEALRDTPQTYFRSYDPALLLISSSIQSYYLTVFRDRAPWHRCAGNLIGPAVYSLTEMAIEGMHFWDNPNHIAYWVFAVVIGLAQFLRYTNINNIAKYVVLIIENMTRASIIFLMYYLFEMYANPAQTESFSTFFTDTSHQFVGIAILFFGFTIGLANAASYHYLQLLRNTSEQLKVFSEWLLGKELLNTSITHPEQLHQHRQQRAILFMDIRGFTQWSEQHTPEEIVQLLSRYYQTIEQVCHEHQTIKWKLSADEVMAIFTQPSVALSAARQLQQRISALLAPEQLGAGIGIHYGLVVEGLLGSSGVKFYDVIGDTVNTAKRIESAAQRGEILISEALYRACAACLRQPPTRTIAAKGKEHPLTVYVLSAQAGQAPPQQPLAPAPRIEVQIIERSSPTAAN